MLYFFKGKGWIYIFVFCEVFYLNDYKVVWFMEILFNVFYGIIWGIGVLENVDGEWKIV